MIRRRLSVIFVVAVAMTTALGACSSDRDPVAGFRDVAETPVGSGDTGPRPATTRPARSTTTTIPRATTTAPRATSTTSTTTTSTTTTSTTTTTTIDPLRVAHSFPIDLAVSASWTPEGHSTYRASDIFAATDCGTPLQSVVDGTVDDVMLDSYDRGADDPALRGGNAVSIVGVDGVRYYYAHFEAIDPAVTPGAAVTMGQVLGTMGTTGRSGACHLHFALSLPCPDQPDDWWIRRGVIWPDQYLSAWRDGQELSPLPELQSWFADYPDACRSVEDTPYAIG